MKKIIALALALCMIFALCACGTAKPAAPAAEAEPAANEAAPANEVEDVTLTVFHYMVQETKQVALDAVEAAYAAEHPELNITWNNVVYGMGNDYYPQLQTALASGDQPEIIMGNPSLYPDLVEQGFVADLSDNETINGLKLTKGDLGGVSTNGKIYAFPLDYKTYGVLYNVDIYNELGLKVPTSYSELLANCEKIAASGKYDVWAHCFADASFGDIEIRNYLWNYAYNNGDVDVFEKIMSGEKKLTDYPYFKDALELWGQRLAWMRNDAMTNDQIGALQVFASGQAAMTYFGSWAISELEAMIAGTDFNYDFFIEPCDDNGTFAMLTQVDQSFMVNPQSENFEVACDFMEYWMANGAAWSELAGQPLVSGFVSDTCPVVIQTIAEMKKGNVISYGDFTTTFTSQFTSAYRTNLTAFAESYANGKPMSADECLANMQAKFDQIIAES